MATFKTIFMRNKSLGIFSTKNPFRLTLNRLITWRWFHVFVVVMIISNGVFLALADPLCEGHADIRSTGHPCANKSFPDCQGDCFCSKKLLLDWTDSLGNRIAVCDPFCYAWMSTRRDHFCAQHVERVRQSSEIVYQVLFTLEVVLKIVAMGFILHEGSYLRDGWNWIDFIVVIAGWFTYLPDVANVTALRTIRILRPLRAIGRVRRMRSVISALIMSFRPLVDVFLLFAFVIVGFAIIAVQLFPGTFRGRCFYSEGPLMGLASEPNEEAICSLNDGGRACPMKNGYRTHCSLFRNGFHVEHMSAEAMIIQYRRLYGDGDGTLDLEKSLNPNLKKFQGHINFDNVGYSALGIFQSLSLEGWTEIMYMLQAGWSSVGAICFFLVLITFGGMFMIKLTLVVIAERYSKAESLSNPVVHTLPRVVNHDKLFAKHCCQNRRRGKPLSKSCWDRARLAIRRIVLSKAFTAAMMGVIGINTLVLSMEFYDHTAFQDNAMTLLKEQGVNISNSTAVFTFLLKKQSSLSGMHPTYDSILETINFYLTILFFVEMIIKLVGLGFKDYVFDIFNFFGGSIVILSMIEIVISNARDSGEADVRIAPLFRSFRLFRLFKLVRPWKGLARIIRGITFSLRSVVPLLIVLIIFILSFALLGMQLYGGHFPPIRYNARSNFDTLFPSKYGFGAVMTVFQILTGEEWNEVMYTGMTAHGVFHLVYFVLVVVVGVYLIMNLFLAILLEGLRDADRQNDTTKSIASSRGVGQRTVAVLPSLQENVIPQDVGQLSEISEQIQVGRLKDETTGPVDDRETTLNNWMGHRCAVKHDGRNVPNTTSNVKSGRSSRSGGQDCELEEGPFYGQIDIERGTSSNLVNAAGQHLSRPAERKVHTLQRQRDKEDCNDNNDKEVLRDEPLVVAKGLTGGEDKKNCHKNDKNCFLISQRTPFYFNMKRLVESKLFQTSIFISIVFSCVVLAIENPSDFVVVILPSGNEEYIHCQNDNRSQGCGICCGPNSTLGIAFEYVDVVLTVVFVWEMLLKLIVYGVVAHKGAYFRNPWNVLDSVIVVVGLIAMVEPDIIALRSLRTFRALRPLRLIKRNPGLKTAVTSLFKAIPAIGNVFLVCLLFYFVFAILGVQLFAGKLRRCFQSSLHTEFLDQGVINGTVVQIRTSFDCAVIGGVWENPREHKGFDNVFDAILTLFEASTFEGWVAVMSNTMDGVGFGLVPQLDYDPFASFFYVIFAVVGGFFVVNLFTGVVIDNYRRIQSAQQHSTFLTTEQTGRINGMRVIFYPRPRPLLKIPTMRFRKLIFVVVTNPLFEYIIFTLILLNVALLATNSLFRSDAQAKASLGLGYFFSIVFLAEAVMKLIALGPRQYFREKWNIFDFLLVMGSIPSLVPSLTEVEVSSIVRIFRVARFLRIARSASGLRRQFETLLLSLPSLANIGGLLLLVYVVFAILGVNFFWNVRYGVKINANTNFQTFGVAMLTLFRMTTGEGWNGIMHDCMREQCQIAGSDNSMGCGHPVLSVFFFVIFNIIGNFVLLNFFVAVIMDSYAVASKNKDEILAKEKVSQFADTWAQFDPIAQGWLDWHTIVKVVRCLDAPLGVGPQASSKEARQLLSSIDLQSCDGKVKYLECFYALLQRVVEGKLPNRRELYKRRQQKILYSLTKGHAGASSVCLHLAAAQVQAAFAGFKARQEVTKMKQLNKEPTG